jgi:hypothetical protein
MHRPPLPIEPGELLGALTGTLCPLVFIALVSYLEGLYIFGPLYTRAAWKPPRTHFGLVEMLVLIVQLQLAGGAALFLIPLWDPEATLLRYGAALAAWVLMGCWWWTGIRMLSLARVEQESHRTIFMAFILPAGYIAAVIIMLTPFAIVGIAMMAYHWIAYASTPAMIGCLVLPAVYVAGFCIVPGVQWYCRRIADRARDAYAHDEGIDFGPITSANVGGLLRWQGPMASEREVRFVDEKRADG